jgi:hypothetical protein
MLKRKKLKPIFLMNKIIHIYLISFTKRLFCFEIQNQIIMLFVQNLN